MNWLPESKSAALCLSIDDVHPAAVAAESLSHVRWLQSRHPQLRVTFFTTPDWRTIEPYPVDSLLSRLPVVRNHVFTVPVYPAGTYRLDRHESFCAMLREWPGGEVALHGLHHVRRGLRPVLEFADRSVSSCRRIIAGAEKIFERARLPFVRGIAPPGWHATPQLLEAMQVSGFHFVASARDLDTPVRPGARTAGSGMKGVSLLHPEVVGRGVVHFTTNFQATSHIERATAIVENGGLLSIKAHLLAASGSYRALDGLTTEYREYLDRVLCTLEDRFGDDLWWTSMDEIARGVCQ
jgi:hypothetical protein